MSESVKQILAREAAGGSARVRAAICLSRRSIRRPESSIWRVTSESSSSARPPSGASELAGSGAAGTERP